MPWRVDVAGAIGKAGVLQAVGRFAGLMGLLRKQRLKLFGVQLSMLQKIRDLFRRAHISVVIRSIEVSGAVGVGQWAFEHVLLFGA